MDVVDDSNAIGLAKFFIKLASPRKSIGHFADEGDGARVGESQIVGQIANAEYAEEFRRLRVFVGDRAVGEHDFADVGVRAIEC